ncbi:MAG: GNAT family N-acetyltransferase [Clostridiales Family XIII bacterium]|nr:GNAT family N-acetyltransferase [Clostridiales Family XIII bacterium]
MVEEMTHRYRELIPFFIEQGLEFAPEDAEGDVPPEIVKCWQAVDDYENLLAGCVLAKREGQYICDGIATAPEARGKGVASILLDFMLQEIAKDGGNKIYLVARTPEFFLTNGFVKVERSEAPEFFECFTCDQYQTTCQPEVMRFDIDPKIYNE